MKKIIFSLIIIATFNANATSQISNLIIPASYFINHEKELKALDSRLAMYNTVGVVGVSGIGKTQLARSYANNNKNKYNIVWFFDCRSDLSEQFLELIKKINLELSSEKKLIENPHQAKKVLLEYLMPRKDWLIVFDNLKLNQNNHLLDIISWEHNGHIIFCSQETSNLSNVIEMSYLSTNNSLDLVKRILSTSNIQTANDLANLFPGHPLLIVQSSMFLNENKYMSALEYKELIRKADNKLITHVKMVLKNLPQSTQNLLHQMSVINNHLISRNILENIISNKNDLSKDIYNLKKFGLIMGNGDHENNQIFELHDMIKETVIEVTGDKMIQENISNIIDKLNTLIPKGVVSKHLVLTMDSALRSNLEVLLNNAEKYKVDVNKIMELRKNLMSLYLSFLDYYNCQKMADWLLEKKDKEAFKKHLKIDKDKITFSEYLTDIGVFEDFAKTDYIRSIKYLEEARDTVNKIEGYPEVKFTIFSQLSQIYAFCGNIDIAYVNLKIVEEIINNNCNADFDLGLYWFIRAKVFLSQGNYQEAENAIENNIEAEKHLPQNTFTAPTYILQAEILNYLKNFQKAYDVSKRIYEQETKSIKGEHEIHARVLTQLSKSELEIGKFTEARLNIEKAIKIYMKNDNIVAYNQLANSHNTDLASALVVKAEILTNEDAKIEAMNFYSIAETIFHNRYGNNMYNMNNVKYLYLKASEASYNFKDPYWHTKFNTILIEKFTK